ncbi:E3 ubiquitin-protein ligase TRIM21-like isoform X2 [Sander lucioperca]|uniref:E3 ubiquitin-protein ligase TRIM21-like isoform X2 n=1 Tax=Sander lucioperca TaxID=283035 RepID=UPI0016534DF3|nr:E3 ubiquitin-protein ligase TRIM21-like isoform X2 [Sander lucioperca]
MAAENYLQSEDQFLCSICLDVFTDPVTIPCGHNFCKNCITEHWNTNDQYLCPMCEEAFTTRPDLRVNTLFSEMLAQFRQSAQQKASSSSSSEQQVSKPGEVPCDVCTGTKLKVELGKTGAEIQQMIQKRRLKIQEVKHSVDLSEEDADREIAEGVQVFTSLKESVERGLNELINTIKEKQKTRETQAEAFIKELEQEISELMKRSTEVEQVLRTEDHLHLLQSVQSLNIQQPPPTKDWIKVSVHQSYEGTVVKAVTQLEETLSQEMKKLLEAELKRVQQYAVDVTLDPDTAHPNLILSDDGKQVYRGGGKKNLPDNPERFSLNRFVLGRQSFSSGRFYFEVQVKGKTKWDLGVARESIARKASIPLNPQYGNWTIWLRNGCEYKALDAPPVRLSLKSRPQKVGVFVNYEAGLVSFFDVDAADLIYSFTGCSFTEKLFPFFSPCKKEGGENSAPLIISPVNYIE